MTRPKNLYEMLTYIEQIADARVESAFLRPYEGKTTAEMAEVKECVGRIRSLITADIDRSYDHMYGRNQEVR